MRLIDSLVFGHKDYRGLLLHQHVWAAPFEFFMSTEGYQLPYYPKLSNTDATPGAPGYLTADGTQRTFDFNLIPPDARILVGDVDGDWSGPD